MRYMAIDHGEKRTGIAICDRGETLASPLTVLTGQGGLANRITKIIDEEHIEAVVIGLPYNMDGTEGHRAKSVRRFADELSKNIDIEVVFFDERLSSFDAEQKLSGLELTHKKKKKHLDAIAAASILQSFLDNKHSD